eukprot:g51996.t1
MERALAPPGTRELWYRLYQSLPCKHHGLAGHRVNTLPTDFLVLENGLTRVLEHNIHWSWLDFRKTIVQSFFASPGRNTLLWLLGLFVARVSKRGLCRSPSMCSRGPSQLARSRALVSSSTSLFAPSTQPFGWPVGPARSRCFSWSAVPACAMIAPRRCFLSAAPASSSSCYRASHQHGRLFPVLVSVCAFAFRFSSSTRESPPVDPSQAPQVLFWIPKEPTSVVRAMFEVDKPASSQHGTQRSKRNRKKKSRRKAKTQEETDVLVVLSCLDELMETDEKDPLPAAASVAYLRTSRLKLAAIDSISQLDPAAVEPGLDFSDLLHTVLDWELSSVHTLLPSKPPADTAKLGKDAGTEVGGILMILDGRVLQGKPELPPQDMRALVEEVEAHGSEDLLAQVQLDVDGKVLPDTYVANGNHAIFSTRGLGFTQVSTKCLSEIRRLLYVMPDNPFLDDAETAQNPIT